MGGDAGETATLTTFAALADAPPANTALVAKSNPKKNLRIDLLAIEIKLDKPLLGWQSESVFFPRK